MIWYRIILSNFDENNFLQALCSILNVFATKHLIFSPLSSSKAQSIYCIVLAL